MPFLLVVNTSIVPFNQGRHRFLKSGKAIERRRRSARAEGPRGGGGYERGYLPLS